MLDKKKLDFIADVLSNNDEDSVSDVVDQMAQVLGEDDAEKLVKAWRKLPSDRELMATTKIHDFIKKTLPKVASEAMDNNKIASELVSLAKSLIGGELDRVANYTQDIEEELSGIESSVKKLIGNNLGGLSVDKRETNEKYYVLSASFTGADAGILKSVFDNIKLTVRFQLDEPLPDGSLFGSVNFDWWHPGGGHNGFTVGNIWFFPDTGKVIAKKR